MAEPRHADSVAAPCARAVMLSLALFAGGCSQRQSRTGDSAVDGVPGKATPVTVAASSPSRITPSARLWLHLGTNVAARDWHELTGNLLPLPSADSQRYFVVGKPLVQPVRRLFAGQPGLEAPYSPGTLAAGDLTGIIAAGYPTIAGIFGAHRLHHTAQDDARCLDAAATPCVVKALKRLVTTVIQP